MNAVLFTHDNGNEINRIVIPAKNIVQANQKLREFLAEHPKLPPIGEWNNGETLRQTLDGEIYFKFLT